MDWMGVVSIVGTVGTIISIPLAFYFYLKSRRTKVPFWHIKTINFGQPKESQLPKLQVFYDGKRIENVSMSKIMFWNAGTEPILRDDVDPEDKIRIVARDGIKILDTVKLASNSENAKFETTYRASHNDCLIDFKFLEKNQGGVVLVVHTGTSSQDIQVKGYVVRGKVRFKGTEPRFFVGVWKYISIAILAITGFSFVSFMSDLMSRFPQFPFNWILISIIAMVALLLTILPRIQKTVPEGLEVFEDGNYRIPPTVLIHSGSLSSEGNLVAVLNSNVEADPKGK